MNEPRTFQNQPPQGQTPYTASPGYAGADVEDYDPLEMKQSQTGFNYVVVDSQGVTIKGFVQTTDLDLAQKELERAGIRVISISPRRAIRQTSRKPTMIEFATLAEQFGDLMDIGEPPTQVCRLLA
jgi:hypothetical protein